MKQKFKLPKSICFKKWLKEFAKTGNGLQSALKAYNCKNPQSAKRIGVRNKHLLKLADDPRAYPKVLPLTKRLEKRKIHCKSCSLKILPKDSFKACKTCLQKLKGKNENK